MAQILSGIDHLIVVMLENRSLDNMLGALYDGTAPSMILPPGSTPAFDGVRAGLANPSNPSYFDGEPPHSPFMPAP